jgi:hypothetical protein
LSAKLHVLAFVLLLTAAALAPTAQAAMLGVNRVSMEYTGVLRDGYAEQEIIVSSGAERPVDVYYEARGDIADWISFEPGGQPLTISADSPGRIKVMVKPPADARADTYEGIVVVSTGPLGEQTGNIGANVIVSFDVKVKVHVTDTQILACTSGGFDIRDAEIGDRLDFSGTVSNSGNVRIRPEFAVVVYDQMQQAKVAELAHKTSSDIFPTTSARTTARLSHTLGVGQYWATVNVPFCDGESLVTFSVLEKGGISDQGEFVRLENEAWAYSGETVRVGVYFRNNGERQVGAQFKGILSKDGKIVRVINSDEFSVEPGELSVFDMFITPEDEGQYRITGRVHYNNKITAERGSMLNVNDAALASRNSEQWLSYGLAGVILIVGVLGFGLIRRRRRKRRV